MVDNSFFWTLTWLVLGGIGFAAQYMTERQNEDLMQAYVLETEGAVKVEEPEEKKEESN